MQHVTGIKNTIIPNAPNSSSILNTNKTEEKSCREIVSANEKDAMNCGNANPNALENDSSTSKNMKDSYFK